MDLPGSPLTPFWPGRPLGRARPGSPGTPRSPFKPIGPSDPIGPYLLGGPSGPGLPRFPGFPRRPLLPFGPDRQAISSLAQIWFCSERSSSLMSCFTSETVWISFCSEVCGEARFFHNRKASF